jgi:hypothetical protein
MNDRQAGTLDQLRGTLRAALPGLDAVAKDAIISALAPELRCDAAAPEAERRGINRSLNEANAYYAIRAEDLKLIEQCAPIAVALYATLTNPVSVVGGLMVLLFRYRRHRIRLDGTQALILKTLIRAGSKGLALNELCNDLQMEQVSPDIVVTTLKGLENVKKENNDFVPLVAEDAGRWYAKDL